MTAEIAAIRARHERVGSEGSTSAVCQYGCNGPWPCDTARVYASLAAVEASLDEWVRLTGDANALLAAAERRVTELRTMVYGLVSDRLISNAPGDWMRFESDFNDAFDSLLRDPEAVKPLHRSGPVHDIWINRAQFRIEGAIYTGAELRYVPTPAIQEDYDLWTHGVGGPDYKIELTDSITITDGKRFYTAPKVINAGQQP